MEFEEAVNGSGYCEVIAGPGRGLSKAGRVFTGSEGSLKGRQESLEVGFKAPEGLRLLQVDQRAEGRGGGLKENTDWNELGMSLEYRVMG